MAATYEVPSSDELKPYSTFELKDFKVRFIGSTFYMRYELPEILAGKVERIWLKGKFALGQSQIVLTGPNAKALCEGVYESMHCEIVYNDLDIDESLALEAIKKVSQSPLETNLRLQVTRAFSTDPVGIINY